MGDNTIGEFVYTRGSPWSLRVLSAMQSLGVLERVKTKNTKKADDFTDRTLAAEAFKPEYKDLTNVSVPMLFFEVEGKETVIRESMDIIHFLAKKVVEEAGEEDSAQKKFANNFIDNLESFKELDEDFQKIMRRFRALSTDVKNDPVKYFLPTPLLYVPLLRGVVYGKLKKYMKKKYYDIGMSVSEENVLEILGKANESIKTNGFVAGTEISFADHSFLAMMEFIAPTHYNPPISTGTIITPTVREFAKMGWKEKCPELLPFREKVIESVFTKEVVAKGNMRVKHKLPDPKEFY